MNIEQLQSKIKDSGIPENQYFINGIYGSTNDGDKLSMRVHSKGYEVYFSERGEKNILREFTNESDACVYFYKRLKNSWDYNRIQRIEGLEQMPIEDRLEASGMKEEFENAKVESKSRAKEILRWLRIEEEEIKVLIQQ